IALLRACARPGLDRRPRRIASGRAAPHPRPGPARRRILHRGTGPGRASARSCDGPVQCRERSVTSESPPRRPATRADAPARRDPARTRARLLDAAVAEFGDHGFSGARTDRIARNAGSNIRMLYHYFGSKDELYVAVLEAVLADLRHDELQLDIDTLEPLEGLLCIFDFVENHFAAHPRLRKLLAFENLNEARHLA